jgi:hypothetical protein
MLLRSRRLNESSTRQVPRQQFVDAIQRMLGDLREPVAQIRSGSRPFSLAEPIRLLIAAARSPPAPEPTNMTFFLPNDTVHWTLGQPAMHVIKQWLGLRHADFSSPIRWLSANLRFDGIPSTNRRPATACAVRGSCPRSCGGCRRGSRSCPECCCASMKWQ